MLDELVAITNTREHWLAMAGSSMELMGLLKSVTPKDLPALRKALVFAEQFDLRTRQKLLGRAIRRMEADSGSV